MNEASSGATSEASLRLQVGGTLIPGRDIYIARPEDEQLFALLGESEYVNILSSRQVGKSSLMLHTAFRLKEERGARFAVVDLTSLGTPDNAGSYFRGLVGAIARQLQLTFDQQAFWRENTGTETHTQQFVRFFREVVAGQIDAPVVICLDEIDSTLKLSFTDDLFTALRAMYNERAIVPEYQRIAFCLVGVATPDELIKDRRTTPYNVGKTLWLGDFDPARDDLTPLEKTLSDDPQRGPGLLQRVLHWTGGHPFLTNRLCQDLRTSGVAAPEDVDRFVTERYATLDRLGEDVHIQQILRFVRERLSDGLASFDLYERILKGAKERDQPSLAHAELKLSGLVRRDGTGMLVPRNRIYERLFGPEWVRKTRPKQEVRRYRRLALAAAAVLLLGAIGVATYYRAVVVPSEAQLVATQAQIAARRDLERLRVTLSDDPRGWTQVGLPAQDTLAVLQKALPSLNELATARDFKGFALDLSEAPAVDLAPLGALAGLRGLDLRAAKLTALEPLAGLAGLQELDISHNPVSSLAPLSNLLNLRKLDASMTQVSDLEPLRGLAKLESLDVAGTRVNDLGPLSGLTKLEQLDLSSTPVKNLSPLARLVNLKELNLSRTNVEDLAPLAGLVNLRTLALDGLGGIEFNADRIPDLKILRDPAPGKAGTAYQAGETFRDCHECPQMVVVPAGSFEMGSPESEVGRFTNEGPRHPVNIAQPFAVSKYEVRFDEWAFCVQDGDCKAVPDAGWGRGSRPVISVSWEDAKRYVEWLSRKAGHPYRLLTEAEWEYAARAGSEGPRSWHEGEDPCRHASVYDKQGERKYALGEALKRPSESFGCDDGYPETAPVGMFLPNAFGLHDMLGNVWEWTEDCYRESYDGGVARNGTTADCAFRVFRGGGWLNNPQVVRSASRLRETLISRYNNLGFRVARTLTP